MSAIQLQDLRDALNLVDELRSKTEGLQCTNSRKTTRRAVSGSNNLRSDIACGIWVIIVMIAFGLIVLAVMSIALNLGPSAAHIESRQQEPANAEPAKQQTTGQNVLTIIEKWHSDKAPVFNLSELAPIHSNDSKVLVAFAGYIEYTIHGQQTSDRFTDLKPVALYHWRDYSTRLILVTSNFELHFHFAKDKSAQRNEHLHLVEISRRRQATMSDNQYALEARGPTLCKLDTFTPDNEIILERHTRYACLDLKTYSCHSSGDENGTQTQLAKLHVVAFAIEVNDIGATGQVSRLFGQSTRWCQPNSDS